jgi:hypothetical protein
MEDIDAIKGLGDQAPTETKPLHYQSPSLFLKIGITSRNQILYISKDIILCDRI